MKNHQTLGQFITSVRLEIDALTYGGVDLDNLPAASILVDMLSDMHANGYTPHEAAMDILDSQMHWLRG